MVFSIFALLCAAACWKSGEWRAWKEYYPTMLYLYIGSLSYGFLFRQKPLWEFNDLFFKFPFLNLVLTAILYPCTVLLFLAYYPQKRRRQAFYLLLCAAVYTAVEGLSVLLGDFRYYNGWNFLCSAAFNLVMFPMIRLHDKKPLFVWPISTALAFAMIWLFHIPLAR